MASQNVIPSPESTQPTVEAIDPSFSLLNQVLNTYAYRLRDLAVDSAQLGQSSNLREQDLYAVIALREMLTIERDALMCASQNPLTNKLWEITVTSLGEIGQIVDKEHPKNPLQKTNALSERISGYRAKLRPQRIR